jgi:hypothetical protein
MLELKAIKERNGEMESNRKRNRTTWMNSRRRPVKAEMVVEFTIVTSFVNVEIIEPACVVLK